MEEILISLPSEFSSSKSGLLDIRHEEDVITWLWAYPHLIPWQRDVVWLYTPVVGNKKWPGDLWGLDSAGNLLILECKKCKRHSDPFEDIMRYHRRSRPELTSDHWRIKFKRHLRAELRFDNGYQERPAGRTDSLLP